jgi:hypothetical protein
MVEENPVGHVVSHSGKQHAACFRLLVDIFKRPSGPEGVRLEVKGVAGNRNSLFGAVSQAPVAGNALEMVGDDFIPECERAKTTLSGAPLALLAFIVINRYDKLRLL